MSSSGEVYGMHIMPDRFNADILLPYGLYTTITCKREDTLETVKKQLWKTLGVSTLRCFNFGDQSSYIFSAVTYDAKFEEFYEESRRLCDLRLFDLTLKLIEPEGNKEEKKLNSMIDLAIGKKVNELLLDLPRDIKEEVTDFRKCIEDYDEILAAQIDQGNVLSSYSSCVDVPFKIKIMSASMVNVRQVGTLYVKAAIYQGTECLDVQDTTQVEPSNPKWDQWLKFNFHCTELPRCAKLCISMCVVSKKKTREIFSLGSANINLFDYRGYMRSGKLPINLWPPPKNSEELLFPLGCLGSNPNSESVSIVVELLSFDRHVVFAPIQDIYTFAAHAIKQEPTIDCESIIIPPHLASSAASSSNNCHTHYSSIRVDFRNRTLSNSCADTRAFIERRLSSSSNTRRDSMSATYNDQQTMRSRRPTTNSEKFSAPSSRSSSTASMLVRTDSNAASRLITSSITATSIASSSGVTSNNVVPTATKSFSIATSTVANTFATPHTTSNSIVGTSNTSAVAPATGSITTTVSTTTATTPANSSIHSLVSPSNLTSTTPTSDSPIISPSTLQSPSSLSPAPLSSINTSTDLSSSDSRATEDQNISLVNALIATPPFTPLTPHQKTLLWNMRFYCKRVPESLPKLLDAIDWKSRNQLSQLYVLLDEWGQVSLETALRLLDTKYEDSYVRQHAVRWLDQSLDEEMMSCYLLQFVQVLKTEPYLENELSKFLVNRALMNQAIGNQFFWYLKSECDEVNEYHNTIRFRYLLERYLRGLTEERLTTLVRQVQGLDKLMNLAEAMKDKTKEDRMKFMQSQMQRVDFSEMLQNIPDPIDHRRFLGSLLHDECRIMDSAKRPLWLVWSLPIMNDERSEIYAHNPKSEEDIISISSRSSKRSYSYSGSKDYPTKEVKTLANSIKEEDSTSVTDAQDPSRFSSRTMTSSSDSAKGTVASLRGNLGAKGNDLVKTSSVSPSNCRTCASGRPVATCAIIFKIGDDLRQDMLTLQIIRIVDSIWRQEGLDMCMLAYTCLATGKNVGIIEVVNRAETITSIQKSGGKMATIQIDSTQLHRWIKERNYENYDEAIRRFTRSCAGYSVLTFVLGIADRNPDNIMVSEDGRIFHIDFGHFLGHFKKKFGINRERVPFVLTEDFLYVIARGSDIRKNGFFDAFRELCGEAYVSLRRHSNLLITLFTMMLRTGIPELRTLEDISYLKTSLQVGVSEEKAREFFQTQFFEAYAGAWATKVDWFFHNIKRM